MTDTDVLLRQLHDICMAYPETEEIFEGSVGKPVYKVSGRIFAMQHPVEGAPSMWFKAPPGVQEAQIATAPDRYFRPPYVGHNGWIGTWLDDDIPWPEVADLIDDAWRMTAKKSLIARYDAQHGEVSS